ncbi:hypothetical protein LINPERHAP1_LOCUS3245, partial [Linum perenne]
MGRILSVNAFHIEHQHKKAQVCIGVWGSYIDHSLQVIYSREQQTKVW